MPAGTVVIWPIYSIPFNFCAGVISTAFSDISTVSHGLPAVYHLRDNDSAGDFAEERLGERAREAGIAFHVLTPAAKDLNADLREGPLEAVKQRIAAQLDPQDQAQRLDLALAYHRAKIII